ncbi:ABC transporter permease [Ensifer adhaerens]|uniref:ABC transporter permease n=1 Tax=Ensifer adhaerens TaxID=106592 RepID=UPI003D0913BC
MGGDIVAFQVDRQLGFLATVNVAAIVAGAVLVGASFVELYNFQSMASQVPELGFLAFGVMLAMMSGNGGIDLSGIALANLSGVAAYFFLRDAISADDAPLLFTWSLIGAALAIGLVGGMLNGFLIAQLGLTPIIATLGTQLLFTGLAIVLTNGSALSIGYVEPLDDFGNAAILSVPQCFALFLVVALAIGAVLRFTPFGQRLLLLGNNAKAARYAGIPEKRILFLTYTVCGLLASVAGIVIAARTSSVKWDYGSSYVLIAILIAVMAGVRPEGGYGRVICVVLSATSLQMLSSLFNFMNISNFFRDLAWGVLLLVFIATSGFDFKAWFRAVRS